VKKERKFNNMGWEIARCIGERRGDELVLQSGGEKGGMWLVQDIDRGKTEER